MIKISKLNINNWVMHNSTPCKVYSISSPLPEHNMPMITLWHDGLFNVNEYGVNHMLLTKEIIKVNFEMLSADLSEEVYKLPTDSLFITILFDTTIEVCCRCGEKNIPILELTYVDELQNFLRSKDWDDIADNLKVCV